VRGAVVFIGTAQEKAYAFSARRLPGKPVRFEFTRNKSVLPNSILSRWERENPQSALAAAERVGYSRPAD